MQLQTKTSRLIISVESTFRKKLEAYCRSNKTCKFSLLPLSFHQNSTPAPTLPSKYFFRVRDNRTKPLKNLSVRSYHWSSIICHDFFPSFYSLSYLNLNAISSITIQLMPFCYHRVITYVIQTIKTFLLKLLLHNTVSAIILICSSNQRNQ